MNLRLAQAALIPPGFHENFVFISLVSSILLYIALDTYSNWNAK